MQKNLFQDLADEILKRLKKQHYSECLRYEIDNSILYIWQEIEEVDPNCDCWNIWCIVYGQLVEEGLLSAEDAFPNKPVYELCEIYDRYEMKVTLDDVTQEYKDARMKQLELDYRLKSKKLSADDLNKEFHARWDYLKPELQLTAVRNGKVRIQGSELYKMNQPVYFALELRDQNKVAIHLEALAVHLTKKRIEKLVLSANPMWKPIRCNTNPQMVSNIKLTEQEANKLKSQIELELQKTLGNPLETIPRIFVTESRSEKGIYRVIIGLQSIARAYPIFPDQQAQLVIKLLPPNEEQETDVGFSSRMM